MNSLNKIAKLKLWKKTLIKLKEAKAAGDQEDQKVPKRNDLSLSNLLQILQIVKSFFSK